MKRKLLGTLLSVTMAVSLLAGCGSSGDSAPAANNNAGGNDAAPANTEAAAEPAAPAESQAEAPATTADGGKIGISMPSRIPKRSPTPL